MKNNNQITKPIIKEIIVVEGRDDTAAINRAVQAITIETHGFGINKNTWKKLENAYKNNELIIFTDPDYAGVNIRKKILKKFPNCKEAFLSQSKATKEKNIGIENAKPNDIIEALKKAKCSIKEDIVEFDINDMVEYNLTGTKESKKRRECLGDILGIGYGNARTFLKKLNGYNISREEFLNSIKVIDKI